MTVHLMYGEYQSVCRLHHKENYIQVILQVVWHRALGDVISSISALPKYDKRRSVRVRDGGRNDQPFQSQTRTHHIVC